MPFAVRFAWNHRLHTCLFTAFLCTAILLAVGCGRSPDEIAEERIFRDLPPRATVMSRTERPRSALLDDPPGYWMTLATPQGMRATRRFFQAQHGLTPAGGETLERDVPVAGGDMHYYVELAPWPASKRLLPPGAPVPPEGTRTIALLLAEYDAD